MRFLPIIGVLASTALAQVPSSDLANMREDMRLLNQRVGELSLRVEQLERENASLQKKADTGNVAYASMAQLNEAVAELTRSYKAAIASSKTETLQHVAAQMERLGNQTNAAIDSLARATGRSSSTVASSSGPSASAPISGFSEIYPKEGISYTVVKGDTLAKIVQKTGGKREDIINANKLVDPSKIQVGQTLFIPIAK